MPENKRQELNAQNEVPAADTVNANIPTTRLVLDTLALCKDLEPNSLEGANIVFVGFNHRSASDVEERAEAFFRLGIGTSWFNPDYIGIEEAGFVGIHDAAEAARRIEGWYTAVNEFAQRGGFTDWSAPVDTNDRLMMLLHSIRLQKGPNNLPHLFPIDMHGSQELTDEEQRLQTDQNDKDYRTRELSEAKFGAQREALDIHQLVYKWNSIKQDGEPHQIALFMGAGHRTVAAVARMFGADVKIYNGPDDPVISIGAVHRYKLRTNHPDVKDREGSVLYEQAQFIGLQVAQAYLNRESNDGKRFSELLAARDRGVLRFMYRVSVLYLRALNGTLNNDPALRDALVGGYIKWLDTQDKTALESIAQTIIDSDQRKRDHAFPPPPPLPKPLD